MSHYKQSFLSFSIRFLAIIMMMMALVIYLSPTKVGVQAQPDDGITYSAEVQTIADYIGKDFEYVQSHLDIQNKTSQLRSELHELFPDSIAGTVLDELPESKLYVYATADGIQEVTEFVKQTQWENLITVEEVEFSLNELTELGERIIRTLTAQNYRLIVNTDIRANEVFVRVESESFDEVSALIAQEFPEQPIRIGISGMPVEVGELVGGLKVQPHPETVTKCTLGFNVIYQNVRHVSTAGHCSFVANIDEWLYHRSTLGNYTYRKYNPDADIQLHRADAFTLNNNILSGSWYNYNISASQPQWAMVGNLVCKQGATTGHTCGKVSAIDVAYTTPTFTSSQIYGEVYNPYNSYDPLAAPGDSGAPVYSNNSAYGWVTTMQNSVLPYSFFFMRVDRAALLGIQVATSPVVSNHETLIQGMWRNGDYHERTVPIYGSGIAWNAATMFKTTSGDLPSGVSGNSVTALSNWVLNNTVYQEVWTASTRYQRTVPINDNVIVWSAANGWVQTAGSNFPGSGSFQSFQNVVASAQVTQGYWRNNQGYDRTGSIINNQPQFGAWNGPGTPSQYSMPGSGVIQSQTSDGSTNTLSITQGIWRGDLGYARNVPVSNGVIQWGSAGAWSAPHSPSTLPGSGSNGPQGQSSISH